MDKRKHKGRWFFRARSSFFEIVSRDYDSKLGGYLKSTNPNKKKKELELYTKVKLIKGELKYTSTIARLEAVDFDNLDIIVNNTNYQPDYLERIYVVKYYQILRKVERKIRNQRK